MDALVGNLRQPCFGLCHLPKRRSRPPQKMPRPRSVCCSILACVARVAYVKGVTTHYMDVMEKLRAWGLAGNRVVKPLCFVGINHGWLVSWHEWIINYTFSIVFHQKNIHIICWKFLFESA